MVKNSTLKNLKLAILKLLCECFNLALPSGVDQRKKTSYIALLEDLVRCCSCAASKNWVLYERWYKTRAVEHILDRRSYCSSRVVWAHWRQLICEGPRASPPRRASFSLFLSTERLLTGCLGVCSLDKFWNLDLLKSPETRFNPKKN